MPGWQAAFRVQPRICLAHGARPPPVWLSWKDHDRDGSQSPPGQAALRPSAVSLKPRTSRRKPWRNNLPPPAFGRCDSRIASTTEGAAYPSPPLFCVVDQALETALDERRFPPHRRALIASIPEKRAPAAVICTEAHRTRSPDPLLPGAPTMRDRTGVAGKSFPTIKDGATAAAPEIDRPQDSRRPGQVKL